MLTAPLNLLVAAAFFLPHSRIGALLDLPAGDQPFYRWLAAMLVGLFGFVYFWMSRQPTIDRPLLAVGACGKALAVLTAVVLFADGVLSVRSVLLFSGDLVFVGLWTYWLVRGGVG